ncbi:MAG: glycoside hydrolase family 15 protein [Rhodospirillaceae bacterium]|nr:glycoside hydrolase family 15 protein [Rhodospirillaceae bacterium]
MQSLDLAMVGNCSYAGLLDSRARLVWACMPRFDGNPVFCDLLQPTEPVGFYEVELADLATSEQRYLPNTAIVETTLRTKTGDALKIQDFAPRFKRHGRLARPLTLVRRLIPLSGTPHVRIRLRPAGNYGAEKPVVTRGSNHLRYILPDHILRLTTNAPISFILEETAFLLNRSFDLILGPDDPIERDIAELAREFLERTDDYWREWVRYLALPFEWQSSVIRAAITLKLCEVEETGAVVAAITTSIPEANGTSRTWDYRYCWLRDTYFVIRAFNRLGVTRTMEEYLRYILNIVSASPDGTLQPVFGIQMETDLAEREIDTLQGYRGHQPVRAGNLAHVQTQNDVYGTVILACAQAFLDERLDLRGDESLFRVLERVGEVAARLYDKEDAGIWELRGRERIHTFSALMCWAACDRLGRIARRLGLADRVDLWEARADTIRECIEREAWNDEKHSYESAFGGSEIDAALLLMHKISFCSARDPRFIGTVTAVERELRRGDHVFRYVETDDFGAPENAFNVCTFWYIDALAAVGKWKEARRLFENMLASCNSMGLLSEDLDPKTRELWGNFPQTYSMVGLIASAIRLSQPWEDAF